MRRAFVLAGLLLGLATAHAGQRCDTRPPTAMAVQQGLDLAERTRQALDASGAQVVLLARAGQDLSRYGLQWSHVGWAYRSADGWRVVHKLNACGTAVASVYRQGLGPFFLDDPFEYRAAFIAPPPAWQPALAAVLADDRRAAAVHVRPYSMVAFAWGQRYQQSNQWAAETLAWAVQGGAPSRAAAQGWLLTQGYRPGSVRVDPFTRLGAAIGAPHIAFDDHPRQDPPTDRLETVTADSLFAWLAKTSGSSALQQVR